MQSKWQAPFQQKYLDQDLEAHSALTAISEGDPRGFDRIIHLYTGQIYNLCRGMLGNETAAEEAVQEIFLIMYRSLNRFRRDARFHPWLYTIAINYIRTVLRKRKYRDRLQIFGFTPSRGPDDFPSPLPGPEELCLAQETEAILETALAALKPVRRAVFLFRRIDGLSITETAQILGIPEGSVKTHLHRALSIMRQKISETVPNKKIPLLKPNPNYDVDNGEGQK